MAATEKKQIEYLLALLHHKDQKLVDLELEIKTIQLNGEIEKEKLHKQMKTLAEIAGIYGKIDRANEKLRELKLKKPSLLKRIFKKKELTHDRFLG